MRRLLLLVCALVSIAALGQQHNTGNSPVAVKELTSGGMLLNQGWKFQAGDNPAFAFAEYNDSQWTPINPTLDVQQLPQLKRGVVWLRLHLLLDSSLPRELGLTLHQAGASEIYLNGQLVQRFGTLGNSLSKVKAIDPKGKVITLSGATKGENVLAVRYALQPGVYYTIIRGRQNPAFRATLLPLANAIKLYQRENTRVAASDMFRIGVFLLFFIFHFAMYLFYRANRANLFFSLFSLFSLFAGMIEFNLPDEMSSLFYYKYAAGICSTLSNLFLFVAYYTVLKERRGWVFWSIMAAIPLAFLLVEFGWGGAFTVILANIGYIEIIRLIVKALLSKHKGAWLFAAGAASYIAFWTLFLLGFQYGYNFKPIGDTFLYSDLLFNLASLCNPVFISIYLGVDFARTSKTLSQKLREVETLSAKTLEQEKEKQQLLATQNEVLEQQVTERTAQLQQSLQQLKATQAQLIQREKMASLGELTAGIAHEIQNPLNFVNNFSELSVDLLEEAKAGVQAGHTEEAIEVIDEARANLQKVSHHGRRADAIVKSMVEHSRSSRGEKQQTNVNALADEYLKLAYNGFRVKNNTFSAVLETHYDPFAGNIDVIPQEVGRVLLNLFNNAFFAVDEKKKQLNGSFEPVVSISTKKEGKQILMIVRDNGTGIPQKMTEKVFQPFFTTKATGEGTGLGLSLSYDIITKGHGGELRVESKEGEGTAFTITLPTT